MENKCEGRKVLVAEDDVFLSNVYKSKLTKEGFEVFIAKNGEEAVEMATKNKPEIILLDLIMPIKNGFETLKELKESAETKDIKVVILSNLSQEEDEKKLLAMGAIGYVVKANVSFREIIELVKQHLGIE
ncbi:MAG: response regulator [Candidatus Moranbacteria bacterium]|nr:response regulator [Candidatus Moranbacteria bacterium]